MSRPTITFKEQPSTGITGLLIQSLPPITRPPRRYDTTEIDGLDGVLIDENGYDAYTKKMKIGLYGAFDIDEVAAYFDGSGRLTTSEEPTKYYNVKCLDGVDFDKLLRFREADVKFLTQPFKYLLIEAPEEIAIITTEDEIEVTNQGTAQSRPIIRLEGEGTVQVTVNGTEAFAYEFPAAGYVVIDSLQQDARLDDGILKNMNMTGEFPLLDPGANTIGWTGTLTRIVVEPKSRWP